MTRILDTVGHAAEYRASMTFDEDAIQALADTVHADRPGWLMALIRCWYRGTERYATVIADARDGERTWL